MAFEGPTLWRVAHAFRQKIDYHLRRPKLMVGPVGEGYFHVIA